MYTHYVIYCESKLYSLHMVYSFIYIQQDPLICFVSTEECRNMLLPRQNLIPHGLRLEIPPFSISDVVMNLYSITYLQHGTL